MVESRLRSSTARTSASLTQTASFGSGLPPWAAMSPPALCTRISIGPSSASTVAITCSTCAASVRSPSTRQVRTPCASPIACAVSVSVVPSPYSAGPCSRMPCTPIGQPSAASRSANARPSPRPAPVTRATCPSSSRGLPTIASLTRVVAAASTMPRDERRWEASAAAQARPQGGCYGVAAARSSLPLSHWRSAVRAATRTMLDQRARRIFDRLARERRLAARSRPSIRSRREQT